MSGVTKLIIFCRRHKCMNLNATRIRQSLSVLVSLEPCCYLLLKKLSWFSFWLNLHIIAFSILAGLHNRYLHFQIVLHCHIQYLQLFYRFRKLVFKTCLAYFSLAEKMECLHWRCHASEHSLSPHIFLLIKY